MAAPAAVAAAAAAAIDGTGAATDDGKGRAPSAPWPGRTPTTFPTSRPPIRTTTAPGRPDGGGFTDAAPADAVRTRKPSSMRPPRLVPPPGLAAGRRRAGASRGGRRGGVVRAAQRQHPAPASTTDDPPRRRSPAPATTAARAAAGRSAASATQAPGSTAPPPVTQTQHPPPGTVTQTGPAASPGDQRGAAATATDDGGPAAADRRPSRRRRHGRRSIPTLPYQTIPGLPFVPAPYSLPHRSPRPRLACMTQTDGLLFDPNTYDPQQFDAETRRLLRATIDLFEGQGKKRILDDDLTAQWPADFVEFVKREKLFATFLTPSEFADGNPGQALGWRAQRRARRDPRVLRADLLVHRAGHHPGARADLAEREQGRQAQGRGRPRGRRGDGVRAVRARARRRRLQHRHGAHAGERGGPRQRHPVPGVGGEVLHRQRQRREHGVGVRAPRRRRGQTTGTGMSSSPPTAGTRTTT